MKTNPAFVLTSGFRMFTPRPSLHILSFAIIIVFVVLPSSNGVDDSYTTCSSLFSCGNLTNIGYPFWGDGRPQYCGHPALQLQCLDNNVSSYPILKIGPGDLTPYHVLSIGVFDRNITLKLQGVLGASCGFYGNDFGNILQFSKSVEKINLLYNCSNGIAPNRSDVPSLFCYHNLTPFHVFYRDNMSALGEYGSCRSFEVPIFRDQVELYKKGQLSFSEAVKHGFEVNYKYSLDCVNCKNSGCICGSSSLRDLACLCKPVSNSSPGKRKLILATAIPGGLIILVALTVGLCYYKKLKFRPSLFLLRRESELHIGSSLHGIPVFPYNELQEVTNYFDATQELGDGGYGIVYYGKLRDGREVAVKRLYEKSYRRVEQFMNEVEILTQLRHPNLVTLYGCTSPHSRELLLVYEYISNGTVADHLHSDRSGSGALTWAMRMKIAIETASALSYLHSSEILHRDVKTTNILLDNNFSVKVADFGLSRLFPTNMTHVSTAPQGTPGYLDPEYHKCYQVTDKSDVYSFGVVLIELISSLSAVDIRRQENEMNLSDYAMNRNQNGKLDELVDQKLGYNSDFKVKRMITLVAELAFQCLQQEKEARPFMIEVLEALMNIEQLDYKALEADEMVKKRTSVGVDDDIEQPPPPSPC